MKMERYTGATNEVPCLCHAKDLERRWNPPKGFM